MCRSDMHALSCPLLLFLLLLLLLLLLYIYLDAGRSLAGSNRSQPAGQRALLLPTGPWLASGALPNKRRREKRLNCLEETMSTEQQPVAGIGGPQAANQSDALNPLADPTVRVTLQRIQISGRQLIQMSVKELNKRLSGCSQAVVSKLKRCRRTLKNRGYARNCRIKRIAAKNQLERSNEQLASENELLKQRNKCLTERVRELEHATNRLSAKLQTIRHQTPVATSGCDDFCVLQEPKPNHEEILPRDFLHQPPLVVQQKQVTQPEMDNLFFPGPTEQFQLDNHNLHHHHHHHHQQQQQEHHNYLGEPALLCDWQQPQQSLAAPFN